MKFLLIVSVLYLTSCATKPTTQESQPQPTSAVQSNAESVAKPQMPEKKETVKSTAEEELVCKFGEHVRSVRIEKPSSTSCDVIYTKDGESGSVASAKTDLSYCDKVKEKIRANLTGFGYACQ